MTQAQLIELVQQHHPEMGETQIRLYLNRALDEFCRKTRILNGYLTTSTVVDQRYYALSGLTASSGAETAGSQILEITRVDYDGYEIPRLIGKPEKVDVS